MEYIDTKEVERYIKNFAGPIIVSWDVTNKCNMRCGSMGGSALSGRVALSHRTGGSKPSGLFTKFCR